jgi:hypothetical protein
MVSMKKPIKMDDEMGYPYFRKPPYGFMLVIPSGKHTKKQKTMENHQCSWVNQLVLWPFSIAMLVYQRVRRGDP